MFNKLPAALVLAAILCCWAFAKEPDDDARLPAAIKKLVPLHEPLGLPQPGDWLTVHPEPGQTFAEYLRSRPVRPDARRRVIYVQPLGDFTATERKILDHTARYMEIYFQLPVKVRDGLPLEAIPASARRVHPTWGDKQILTTYVLSEVLFKQIPDDATAYIALTASDLWPGEGWNFVFGQASLDRRVGVWSIYRNGDPHEGDEAFRLCLRRTLKTATHETGHMFSMLHCTAFECNMCGSNHRAESDRHPLWLCPHCLAKLCAATAADPEKRFRQLTDFAEQNDLDREAEFYRKSLAAIQK